MVVTRSEEDILTLDESTPVFIDYIAEGAANVVFALYSMRGPFPKDDDYGEVGTINEDGFPRIDTRLQGKLLRLRKDVPSISPVMDSHQHFKNHIEPLFPEGSLIEQVFCKVTTGFIKKCVKALRDQERQPELIGRPKKRHGVYLAEDEPYATLMTDMRHDKEHASAEFKPKWLAQSPSAPPGSKRCRTCALRAMRYTKDKVTPEAKGVSRDFCPLTLVDDSQDVLEPSLQPMLVSVRGATGHMLEYTQQALPYFHKLPLLRLLRDLQVQKDSSGILKLDKLDQDFMTAMTIRDCTLFIKIPKGDKQSEARIEARLGDLDLKTPDGGKVRGQPFHYHKLPHIHPSSTKSALTNLCLCVPGLQGIIRLFLLDHTGANDSHHLYDDDNDFIKLNHLDDFSNADCLPPSGGRADPWVFAPATNLGSGQYTNASPGDPDGDTFAYLSVTNGQSGASGYTSVQQPINYLCSGVEYTLTYSSQLTISGGQPGRGCSVYYQLADQQLVYIGPPSGDIPPFNYETRSYTFTYYSSGTQPRQSLTILLRCNSPAGSYRVDNVSLVGAQ
ncbi:MAG: hypothetical protein Q9222_004679 [Ikaeria aurantiellina]